MLIKEFLENVCNEIKYKPIREDISEELSLHIQEQKEDYMKEGFDERNAEEKAVSNMGEAEEIGKKLNKIHRPKFDWILFIVVAVLIGFGFLITFIKVQRGDEFYLKRHIAYFVLGSVISIGIYFLDYRNFLNHPKIIYGISTFLIFITVVFGISKAEKQYFDISERICLDLVNLCTLLYIVAFVGFIKKLNKRYININIQKFNLKLRTDILNLLMLTTISILGLMYTGRIAITIILTISYIIIATVHIIENPNRKSNLIKLYATLLIFGIVLAGFCLITQNGIYSRVQRKIIAYNWENDLHGNGWMGYKINQVLNNANWFSGLEDMEIYAGLFDGGTNTALITIIAYCGTIYSAIIIGVVGIFAIKLIIDSNKINDKNGKLLITGFGSFILLQAIFNILMNFNIIPISDFYLPFISYGGSQLLTNMIMIAFILSIYRRKDILTKKGEEMKKIKINISFQ